MLPRLPEPLPQHHIPVHPSVGLEPRLRQYSHPARRGPARIPRQCPVFSVGQFYDLQFSAWTIRGKVEFIQRGQPLLAKVHQALGRGLESEKRSNFRQAYGQPLRLGAEADFSQTILRIPHIGFPHQGPGRNIGRHHRHVLAQCRQIHLAGNCQPGTCGFFCR